MVASKGRQSLRFDILLVKHAEVRIERTRAQLIEVLRAKEFWAQKFTRVCDAKAPLRVWKV